MRDGPAYNIKVKDYVRRYATADHVPLEGESDEEEGDGTGDSSGSESEEMSDMGSLGDDDELEGRMDP